MLEGKQKISAPRIIGEIILSWLIPGSGFLLHKQLIRGIIIMVVLSATFWLGLLLDGSVVFPVWSPRQEGFNVINILTFLSQMGYGGLSILCLASPALGLTFFQGNQAGSFFDLASFYLIVAGGLNYLMVFNFYDRCLRSAEKESIKDER
ncbi:MAG: hypothetical protein N2246_02355 [Candidatus Sumerlaeia bacterium]|nr:hypothetical protein [Candidatus Sumerlaeia bacterium]